MKISLRVEDALSPALKAISLRAEDLRPAMKRIEREIIEPEARSKWQQSGLESRSGELEGAITPWSGKRSVGVTLRTRRGKDLILPKASLHQRGAKAGRYKLKKYTKVRDHTRRGKKVVGHYRFNHGAPWGKVPRRRFFPQKAAFEPKTDRMCAIIEAHLLGKKR